MTSHCYILSLLSHLAIPFCLGLRDALCMLWSHMLRRCCEQVCYEMWLHRQDSQGGSLGLQRLLLQRSTGIDLSRIVANQKHDLNEKFLPKHIVKTHFSTRQELSNHIRFLGKAAGCVWKSLAIMSSREC